MATNAAAPPFEAATQTRFLVATAPAPAINGEVVAVPTNKAQICGRRSASLYSLPDLENCFAHEDIRLVSTSETLYTAASTMASKPMQMTWTTF